MLESEYGFRTLQPPRVGEIVPEYGDPYSVLPLKCINSALWKEHRAVAALVAKAYSSDPDYEPVLTRIGANNWEVNELKPKHRIQSTEAVLRIPPECGVEHSGEETPRIHGSADRRHGSTDRRHGSADRRHASDTNDRINRSHRGVRSHIKDEIDPYYPTGFPTGDLPYETDRQADPFYGPVPGMNRMFGPTFDHEEWA